MSEKSEFSSKAEQKKSQRSSKSFSRINPSIKKDTVNAHDYLTYDLRSSCEECSHFDSTNVQCTFGFLVEPHLKDNQQKSYFLSGKIAFCRFHEID